MCRPSPGPRRLWLLLSGALMLGCARTGLDLDTEPLHEAGAGGTGGGGLSTGRSGGSAAGSSGAGDFGGAGFGAAGLGAGAGAGRRGAGMCGDGVTQGSEGCDDGNHRTGDGCGSDCRSLVALSATAAGATCALLDDGRVKCWGRGSFGVLGQADMTNRGDEPSELGAALPALDFGDGVPIVEIGLGAAFACALFADATIRCWGANTDGQLGLGDTEARGDDQGELAALRPITTGAIGLAVGGSHVCALLAGGFVKCWGKNGRGQLGLGDAEARGDQPGEMGDALPVVNLGVGRRARSVAAGSEHSCAVLDDGVLKCWGDSTFGHLGLGDRRGRGLTPSDMGDALPAVDLGTGAMVAAVAANYAGTCALLLDGRVKCWGHGTGSVGVIGYGRGDDPGEMGDALPAVGFGAGRTARAIHASPDYNSRHFCAPLDNRQVACWGPNSFGQLGLGHREYREPYPGDAMMAVIEPAALGAGRGVRDVAVGSFHVCALLDPGVVQCWGYNEHGELGLGDTQHRGDQSDEMGDALPILPLP